MQQRLFLLTLQCEDQLSFSFSLVDLCVAYAAPTTIQGAGSLLFSISLRLSSLRSTSMSYQANTIDIRKKSKKRKIKKKKNNNKKKKTTVDLMSVIAVHSFGDFYGHARNSLTLTAMSNGWPRRCSLLDIK